MRGRGCTSRSAGEVRRDKKKPKKVCEAWSAPADSVALKGRGEMPSPTKGGTRSSRESDAMKAEEIFLAAVEKKACGERAAYVEGACGNDAALRAQVAALLQSHGQAGSFLEQPLF